MTGHTWLFNVGSPDQADFNELPHQIDPPLTAEDFRAFFNDDNPTEPRLPS